MALMKKGQSYIVHMRTSKLAAPRLSYQKQPWGAFEAEIFWGYHSSSCGGPQHFNGKPCSQAKSGISFTLPIIFCPFLFCAKTLNVLLKGVYRRGLVFTCSPAVSCLSRSCSFLRPS